MPISSYLVYPSRGKGLAVARQLAAIPGCEPQCSEDRSVLVLVTDSPNETAESGLQERLRAVAGLESLALVFRHVDPQHAMETQP